MYFVSPIDNTLHIETFRNLHDVDLDRSVNDPRPLSVSVVQITRCVCRCVCESVHLRVCVCESVHLLVCLCESVHLCVCVCTLMPE